jgi:hypothetical protein
MQSDETQSLRRDLFSSPPSKSQETDVMQTTHQTALEAKHAGLDRKLAEERLRPMPDERTIAELKKQKLRLKEELQRF